MSLITDHNASNVDYIDIFEKILMDDQAQILWHKKNLCTVTCDLSLTNLLKTVKLCWLETVLDKIKCRDWWL